MSGILGNPSVAAAGLAATLSVTSTEHALISMVLLDTPTDTSVESIQRVVSDTHSTLKGTALTVLGATADHLGAPAAAAITQQLIQGLNRAANDEDTILYLDALGNTGEAAALDAIKGYVNGTAQVARIRDTTQVSDTFGVKISALSALRKIPGDQAEGLLLGALNKSNADVTGNAELFIQRELAAEILSGRAGLSDNAVAALTAHKQASLSLPGGYYTYSWNRHLGGSTVGVNLPGFMGIASPPPYYPYLYVRQAADAHIWSYTRNLIYGELLARSTGSAFQFRAYMHIGGGLIKREVNYTLPCTYNAGGNLYNTNITVFNVTDLGADLLGDHRQLQHSRQRLLQPGLDVQPQRLLGHFGQLHGADHADCVGKS